MPLTHKTPPSLPLLTMESKVWLPGQRGAPTQRKPLAAFRCQAWEKVEMPLACTGQNKKTVMKD